MQSKIWTPLSPSLKLKHWYYYFIDNLLLTITGLDARPTNVKASTIQSREMTFVWTPPLCDDSQDPINYTYTFANSRGRIDSDVISGSNITFTWLDPSSTYIFLLAVSNADGTLNYAEPVIVNTMAVGKEL